MYYAWRAMLLTAVALMAVGFWALLTETEWGWVPMAVGFTWLGFPYLRNFWYRITH